MTRLVATSYLDHLRAESRRFREVLADCDPAAAVPSCPAWDAADLLWHLGEVQHFWSAVIADRPRSPGELGYREPRRPGTHDELLDFFDTQLAKLVSALEAAHPDDDAWSWSPDRTVGFTYRRQAHEALIHRLDAELTAGTVSPLDPALATDGVMEVLDVMFGDNPTWGHFEPDDDLVRVDCTDTDTQIWVRLGRFTGTDPDDGEVHDEDDVSVVADPGAEPDVVVEGLSEDLDAWLWRRRDDAAITVSGDRSVYARWRAVLDQPID